MVFAREERLALQHFSEDTSRTPDIDFHVVLLPREHDFWSSVVSCRNVSSHLGILDASEAKVADFQIAVLIYQNITRLEISVYDAS